MELCFQLNLASLFLILFSSFPALLAQSQQHFLGQNINTSLLSGGRCNLSKGKWVYDSSYPLYSAFTCPFIDPEFNCQKAGRPDTNYQHFRWQPFSCPLPRYSFTCINHQSSKQLKESLRFRLVQILPFAFVFIYIYIYFLKYVCNMLHKNLSVFSFHNL